MRLNFRKPYAPESDLPRHLVSECSVSQDSETLNSKPKDVIWPVDGQNTKVYDEPVSTAPELGLINVEDYLRQERETNVKHEYLGGVVYAMSGGRNRHNLLATNTLLALGSRLRGTACRAFNSDTKIRIRLPDHTRFYYPDVSVVCEQNSLDDVFQDRPVVVVEVLSDSTRRTDLGEKAEAYQSIASLEVYLLVEQRTQAVIAYRRTDQGFKREVYQGLSSVIPLPQLDIEFPLSEIYEAVEFDGTT